MSIQALSADGNLITYTDRRRWLWSLSLFWPIMPVISCSIGGQFRPGHLVLGNVDRVVRPGSRY